MTSAVVPIRGMRRLRMTGTRTVGAGTTVEPPVGGRGVKPAAGEAAFVATAAAAAGAAPTAAAPAAVAPAAAAIVAPAAAPAAALRRDARGGGGGSTFCVSSETGGGGACSSIAPGAGSSPATLDPAAAIAVAPAAAPGPSPPAPSPSALGAANAASYSATDENTGSPADAARARVAGSDATIERRRLLTIASRDSSRKFIREVAIRDPYGIDERDLRRLGASDPRGGGGDLVVDVEIDGARCHPGAKVPVPDRGGRA